MNPRQDSFLSCRCIGVQVMFDTFLSRLGKSVFLVLVLMAAGFGFGQSTLTPLWSDGGWYGLNNPPQYSNNGAFLLCWTTNAFEVYSVATGKVVASVKVDGSNGVISSACFNSAGTAVLYGTGNGMVFDYTVAARTQTNFTISEGSGKSIRWLTASNDGKTLAYVITDSSTSDDEVCLYNLATNAAIKRFDYVNPSTKTTASLAFVNDNADLVLSGPTLYNLSGTRVAYVANDTYPIAVSPDQTKVFSYGANGYFYGYAATNLAALWKISPPEATTPSGQVGCYGGGQSSATLSVTSDSEAVIFEGLDYNGDAYFQGVNASTGKTLTDNVKASDAPNQVVQYTCAPNSADIIIGPGFYGAGGQIWSLNSSTGAGSAVATFPGGYVSPSPPLFGNYEVTLGSTKEPGIAVGVLNTTASTAIGLFSADTGAALSPLPVAITDPRSMSPTGAYYASTSGAVLSVYNTTSSTLITSLTEPANLTSTVIWGGSRIAVTDGSHVYTFSFNGAALAKLVTLTGTKLFTLSPDGTKIAVLAPLASGLNGATIYDAGTGKVLFTFSPDPSTLTGIESVAFGGASSFGIHENSVGASSSAANEYRVYSLASTTPTLLSKITYTVGPSSTTFFGYTDGSLSPDGQTVVLGDNGYSSATDPRTPGSVRVYSATTGLLETEWLDQFVPDGQEDHGYGQSTFDFSLDSTAVIWSTHNALVAASIGGPKLSVALSPTSVPGGTLSTGTVTISPTPTVATTVSLASSSTSATVPTSVVIAANTSTKTFSIATVGVAATTSAAIKATSGTLSSTATLSITAPSALTVTFNPSTVNAGTSSTGTVTLNANAGPSGLVVALKSANTAVVSVPGSVTVKANTKTATFVAKTAQPTATGPVAVTASAGSITGSGSLTVTRLITVKAAFNVSSILGGNSALLTITLSAAAPTGGYTVTLASSNPAIAPPASVVVGAGQTTASIGVSAVPVLAATAATLTAKTPLNQTGTAAITVNPPTLVSVIPDSTDVVGGVATYATVQLSGPAPANFTLSCSSSNAAVTLPATFTATKGRASGTITLTTTAVKTVTTVTIKVGTKSFTLTLYP